MGGGERSRTGGDGDDESEEAASVLFSTPPSAASSAADDDADAAEEAYRSILSSAFGPMGENGFVPRYAYPAGGGRGDEDGVNSPPYLYGTIYPSPRMFGSRSAPSRYLPPSGPIPPEEEDPTRSGLASGSALGGGRSSSFSSSLRRASISGSSNGRSGDGGRSALWSGSGRISSPPLHATMIMDSFYLSRQLPADLNCLAESFRSLLMWHRFLHEEVLGSDCDPIVPVIGGGAGVGVGPSCHNVVHPWESDVPANSPIWETALRWVVENEIRRKEGGWRPVFDVPPEIRGSYDYPGDELYRAGLYLIECAENATAEFEEEGERGGRIGGASPTAPSSSPGSFESFLITRCPFAVLDVTSAAALARSDEDLLTMAQVLRDTNHPFAPKRDKVEEVRVWGERSLAVLRSLWNDDRGTFLSRAVTFMRVDNVLEKEEGATAHYRANGSIPLTAPVGHNFLGLWNGMSGAVDTNDDDGSDGGQKKRAAEEEFVVSSVAFQLLGDKGDYSFRCSEYPLWTTGGCSNDNGNSSVASSPPPTAVLDPALNYLASTSLDRSGLIGLASWMRGSTVDLVCGLDPGEGGVQGVTCPPDVLFPRAYDARTGHPITPPPLTPAGGQAAPDPPRQFTTSQYPTKPSPTNRHPPSEIPLSYSL